MAAYAAISYLRACFSGYLHYYDAALPPGLRSVYEGAHKEMKSFQDFVERLDSRSRKRMSASLGRIVEAANEFDGIVDRVDEFEDDEVNDKMVEFCHSLVRTMKKMKEEWYSSLDDEEKVVSSSSSSSKMIGLLDKRCKLKEVLANERSEWEGVYLLAGMTGIGKTTLAREVYEDLDISEWFECRAWVTLGNDWKSKEITEAILAQVDPDAHKMVMGEDEEEIAQRLKDCLKMGKRCLIVVDDVWDYRAFRDYMESVLLHNIKGSRVVLTTRIKSPAYAGPSIVIEMRLLNKKESWDLLREKVFAGGSCPPQLEDVGKKIAEKCDGLPLTIVTIAKLLLEAEEALWIDVAEKRKHQIFIDAYDQISEVLYPSYKELRDDLKLCFLYLGVFPLKYEIHQSKLINLWTAEEIFDQFKEGESRYLTLLHSMMHLDDNSLVVVHEKSTTYSLLSRSRQAIKTCGLHSSWWHFCQKEAKKINFFYVLDSYEDGLKEDIKNQTRLSIHNNVLFALKDVHNSIEKNCASIAKSLLCFGPYNQYMVPLCFGLRFLQRLDALNIRFYDFPLEVLKLVKLVYLALTCNKQLPPSISKLEKLQYLIVHPHLNIKSCGAPSYMPMEIWDLEELKHLHVLGSDLPDPGDKSLEMLSTLLDVSTASCTVLNKLPNLEKLRIRIVRAPEAPDPLCCFDHISNLMKIEALTCIIVNPGFNFPVVPSVASFPLLPHKLKKLSLNGLGYSWKEMSVIAATLQGLLVLKLQCNAFCGQIWEVDKWYFPELRFLLIEDLDLVKLEGARGSFRRLQHLSIKHCYKLEEIKLGNYDMLSWIEIVDSNPLVEKSIKLSMLQLNELPDHLSVHSSWKSERATTRNTI